MESHELSPRDAAEVVYSRHKARKSFLDFITYTMPEFKVSKHHEFVAKKLEAVERGELKRLMLFLPPRHSKSELVSRRFPPWLLGRNPKLQIIHASYGGGLATDFGRETRNIIDDNLFHTLFPKVSMSPDSQASNKWHTNAGGSYYAVGVQGPCTGRGANIGIIDDPVKDRFEADSTLIQKRVWDWYRSTFRTRLQPKASIIILMTRWHDNDLAGKLLKAQEEKGGEQWEVINLPALAEKNDPLGRDENEALWPDWYPKTDLESTRHAVGQREWDCLYQQKPHGRVEGALWTPDIIEEQRVDEHPELQRILIAIDPAVTAHEDSDETGIIVVGKGVDGHGYVLDDLSGVFTPNAWARRVLSAFDAREADAIIGEVNNGGDLVEANIRAVRQRVNFRQVRASRGKTRRAEPVASLYFQRKIHHVGRLSKLEEQMVTFTGVEAEKSPDRMDACFIRGTMIATKNGGKRIEDIKPGDFVITRKGERRVLNSGITKKRARVITVKFTNGAELTGTQNHPVYVKGKGFIALDALVWGDIIATWQNTPGVKKTLNTAKHGRSTMVKSKTDIIYTTKMGTGKTTEFQTWNASHRKNTRRNTRINSEISGEIGPIKSGIYQKHGTNPNMVKNGIFYTQNKDGKIEKQQWVKNASGAAKNLKVSLKGHDFVRENVSIDTTKKNDHIEFATVYNLEVEECNEYYANGVLVHNCVWGLTALFLEDGGNTKVHIM